jgi:thiamine pyrophosphate-dependent acetolactate synthase large subunit-like protein
MNGAEVILRTLADNGVEACFSNPGTSVKTSTNPTEGVVATAVTVAAHG